MARKGQISVQDNIDNNEEFETYLNENYDKIILLEVYSTFCGQCTAMASAVRKIKLEIAGDLMVMAKAPADDVDALERFRGKSEPVFLFISKGKTTKIMFGSNGVRLFELAQFELDMEKAEKEHTKPPRPRVEITERLPEEAARQEIEEAMMEQVKAEEERSALAVQAARKKRVCERLASHQDVKHLNFIMFWPHCHQAHYDLYEKWDRIDLQVTGKELVVLTEEQAKEILYMSDIDANEACMHALHSGEVMAVLLKMSDSDDRDFILRDVVHLSTVSLGTTRASSGVKPSTNEQHRALQNRLLRYSLYEEIPELKEDVPDEEQPPQVTAFMRYASVSKTKPQIRRMRYEEVQRKKREEEEERERLRLEQERLAREAEEERIRLEKQKEDEERIARLQAGPQAKEEPSPADEEAEGKQGEGEGEVEVEQTVPSQQQVAEEPPAEDAEQEPEELPEVEFSSQVTIEGEEYIPPGGLFVPGLYSPPNELAKANGLAVFFPKAVSKVAPIESEFLPPHVLIAFPVERRKEVMEVASQFGSEIIQQGIFAGEDPYTAEHVAYSVKQYDKMFRIPQAKERLALMVSRKRSLPMLTLTMLNPAYISMDTDAGISECQAMFPVGYGDDYQDEESVVEEEVVEKEEEVAPPIESVIAVQPETKAEEEEEEEEVE